MSESSEEDLSEKMSELYVAECNAAKARLEVETECRRIIADNYEKVLEQAKEFSKKVEAPILAKVCDVGYFCDAHVVRTNQLTMEMGASYYMECSIHTAEKIIARRVTEMRRTRQDGLDSIKMLDDKIKFARENFSSVSIDGGPIEIVEKYDEEMEKLFYENRKKRSENKQLDAQKEEKDSSKDREHDEMMKRLEELEKLELENEETDDPEPSAPKPFEISLDELGKLEEIEEDDQESPDDRTSRFGMNERLLAQPGVSQKEMERLLQFLDACDEESTEEEYDEEEEEENDEEEVSEKKNIEKVKLSEKVTTTIEELDSDDDASDENESGKSSEPSKANAPKVVEIVEKNVNVERKKSGVRFADKLENVKTFHDMDTVEVREETVIETKSILRNTEPTPIDRSALEPEQKEISAMSSATFPGTIVEKNPYDCEPSTSKDPAPVITEKKISKFRASRNRL
uniref:Unconventional prefoldin RPB5 interactor n=1 Tax=Caenorhabditis tropicalis TaxID=1561998 RepID=A0A1I7UL51_9PELO